MSNREITCPHCKKTVRLVRDSKGRWIASTTGAVVGAIIGGFLGAAMGIASFGTAIAGTIPVGIFLGTVLGGGGYIVGDKLLDKLACPNCKKEFDI